MFDPVVIVPVFNHPGVIGDLVQGISAVHGLPCIVVDDGSDAECRAVLDEIAARHAQQVRLIRLAHNQGKGAAVVAGLQEASARGHSHALQIDADGQHDWRDIPAFIDLARQNPQAVINGRPVYDASVPRGRLYGRYATHVWVWINTLSFDIADSMCGFRVYPLEGVRRLLATTELSRRMDFDSDIIVRLHWEGVEVINRPTRVIYPPGGVSHFHLWCDNLRISRMHARHFFGMLLRLPRLLRRKVAT